MGKKRNIKYCEEKIEKKPHMLENGEITVAEYRALRCGAAVKLGRSRSSRPSSGNLVINSPKVLADAKLKDQADLVTFILGGIHE